jgi:RND superfamily putative drug exporter
MVKNLPVSGATALRFILPSVLILAWLAVASVGGPTFGKLSSVATNDQAAFLPAKADSTKVQNLAKQFVAATHIPAIVVVESPSILTAQQFAQMGDLTKAIGNTSGVSHEPGGVLGPIPSSDYRAAEYIIQVGGKVDKEIAGLRDAVKGNTPSGTKAYVTGPAGLAADLFGAFKGIDGVLVYVALVAVFVILLAVYRSIVLPFIVLLTAVLALSGAGLLVYHAVGAGWFKLNGESQGILSILAIGAATDYSLLIIARYREALEHIAQPLQAMQHALKNSLEPIAASAATVIAGVLCLLFSQLNSNKDLGPVAALGIAFSFLAAMTFLPAILVFLGRWAFWPFRPKWKPEGEQELASLKTGLEDRHGLWRRIPAMIAARPRTVWLVCLVALGFFVFMSPQFKAAGVSQTDTILGGSDAVTGQQVLARHFPAGSGSPAIVIADANKLPAVMTVFENTPQISGVVPYASNTSPNPAFGPTLPTPTVRDGKVMVSATLNVAADSSAAHDLVKTLRHKLESVDPGALVGGISAIELDTNDASTTDLHTIIPIVLVVILLILILLLRSLVAPVLLIASVILSFSATIGISALVFNHVFHFAGSDAAIPLFGFIFLVALGVDYNIFLMTRVREESHKLGTRPGILRGLSVTGSVITSAGIVLASTFAALAVVPILFLVQIAFIVAFGVLLDTIIVRSLLIPALTYDIGSPIWWPSKLRRTKRL